MNSYCIRLVYKLATDKGHNFLAAKGYCAQKKAFY